MIYYLTIILKILFFSHQLFSLLLALILFFISFHIRNIAVNYKINVDTLKIINKFLFIVLTAFFIFVYIGLFNYWRFLNLSKNSDLKIGFYNLIQTFQKNTYIVNSMNIIVLISLLFFFISLIKLVRKYFFYHFLLIHIYLLNYFLKANYIESSIYDTLCQKIITLSDYVPKRIVRVAYNTI